MATIGGQGLQLDLNVIQKRIGRLKKMLFNNERVHAKALSTAILADYTAINVLIQAIVKNVNEAEAEAALQIWDEQDQTASTNTHNEQHA